MRLTQNAAQRANNNFTVSRNDGRVELLEREEA